MNRIRIGRLLCICALAVIAVAIVVLTGCTKAEKSETIEEIQARITAKATFSEITPTKVSENTHLTFTNNGEGYTIYQTLNGKWGYRYAPSIIYYNDGTWDSWFATNGAGAEWDWISYKNSTDGLTWANEQIVLQPTPDSYDHYSICDPGLIYFNGYYYLGYTSCIVDTNGGINNNVYVARSVLPNGPYEKWNGNGWGGDPMPIVYYDELDSKWGAGEPAFVVVDDVLYMYYSWLCSDGNYEMVATADATSENWPATLQFHGTIGGKFGDQCDVVYIEDIGMFMMVSTENRFTEKSGIRIQESFDGIHFTKGEFISNGISKYCHNMGISKRPNGHIQLSDKIMIGYAFASDGDSWGKWGTYYQPITISYYTGDLNTSDTGKLGFLNETAINTVEEEAHAIGISTGDRVIKLATDLSDRTIGVYWLDQYLCAHKFTEENMKNIRYEYDTTVISISNGAIKPLKEGKTIVKVYYKDTETGLTIYNECKVYVYAPTFKYDIGTSKISEFKPIQTEYTVGLSSRHRTQIRAFVRFANDTWGEAYNDYTKDHPDFPAMVNADKFLMTFEVADKNICAVSAKGVITPKSAGETTVTVYMNGELSFTVTVRVVE